MKVFQMEQPSLQIYIFIYMYEYRVTVHINVNTKELFRIKAVYINLCAKHLQVFTCIKKYIFSLKWWLAYMILQMDREKLMKMAGAVRTGGKGTVRR